MSLVDREQRATVGLIDDLRRRLVRFAERRYPRTAMAYRVARACWAGGSVMLNVTLGAADGLVVLAPRRSIVAGCTFLRLSHPKAIVYSQGGSLDVVGSSFYGCSVGPPS